MTRHACGEARWDGSEAGSGGSVVTGPVSPRRPTGAEPLRLLLVEDSDPEARLFEAMLEDADLEAELVRARTLAEAEGAADAGRFDLVVLDLGLPGSRGLETVDRARRRLPDVPHVVLTGLDDEDVALDSLRRGVEEYLVKDEMTPRALGRTVRYVVARHRFRRQLRDQRAFSRGVLRSLSEHIAVLDADGRIVETNPAWTAFARSQGGRRDGYRDENYLEVTRRAAAADENARQMAWGLEQVLAGARDEFTVEYPCHGPEERRWFQATVTPLLGTAGGVVVSHTDVTERRERQQALEVSEERYRTLFHSSLDPIAVSHRDGRILEVNGAWCELTGYGQDHIGELDVEELYADPDDRAHIYRLLDDEGGFRDYECELRRRDGSVRAVRVTAVALSTDDGRAETVQAILRDVTERKQLEEALEHRAHHDALTDLPNRILFAQRSGAALERTRSSGTKLALVMIDLDRFKLVNESLGHTAGDRLLTEFGHRLRAGFRGEDAVARVGGDEFGVMVQELPSVEAVEGVVDRVKRTLQDPFVLDGNEVRVTASLGVVVVGGDADPGTVPPEAYGDLMRYADLALKRAKANPMRGYHVFDPAADREDASRLHLEQELRRAIRRDEFVLHYQPIVRLTTGEIVGVEPLARWQHPERGLLGSGAFIPLAEESGLIIELGELLLRKACRWLGESRASCSDGSPLVITPNLSGRQFDDPELVSRIATILEESGVRPEQVHFEVTETAIARATDQVAHLKDIGASVAVDDFGTGYSSLTYVRELDVDGIKVDMSFVQRMTEDARDAAIVESVVTLGKALGLATLAEGIETEGQLRAVTALGCDYGQGFHFHRPMPVAELEALLA